MSDAGSDSLARPAGAFARGIPVLIVDDSLLDRRMVGRVLEQRPTWSVRFASSGAEALAALDKEAPRVVVTDLQMPGMDGLTLVEQVRDRYPQVPVVLMTRHGSEEIAVRALRSGAASYVTKRSLAASLIPTVEQVVAASEVDQKRLKMLACLTQRESRFSLDNDPALVQAVAAQLREDIAAIGLCDATGVTRVGIALEEALLNALYHGNLELDSSAKEEEGDAFQRQAEERRRLAPYQHRRVRLLASLTQAQAYFVIADQGRGFDFNALPDPTDPANLERPSGRGVLLMRTFMDQVTYSASGTQVTMIKRRETKQLS